MDKLSLAEIRNAILTYQAGKGTTETFAIANAFIRSMNAGMNVAVLIQKQMVNGKEIPIFTMLRDKNGKKVFPLFTELKQMEAVKDVLQKQAPVEAAVMNLKVVMQMLTQKNMCESILVDPVGAKFNAPLSFFREVMRGKLISHITVIEADIEKLYTNAIVSSSDENMSGVSGVDAAIQNAGGEVFKELIKNDKLDVGDVVVTGSVGDLHSKVVFFTRGPEYSKDMKPQDLFECYFNCLNTAKQLECVDIAFPCISAGENKVPMELVVGVSTMAVSKWMSENLDYPIDVYFCCHDKETKEMYEKFFEATHKARIH